MRKVDPSRPSKVARRKQTLTKKTKIMDSNEICGESHLLKNPYGPSD